MTSSQDSSETSFEFEKLNINRSEEAGNSDEVKAKTNHWTLFLFLCCLTVALSSSFQFGYNISVMNAPTKILKDFIRKEMYLFQFETNSTRKVRSTALFPLSYNDSSDLEENILNSSQNLKNQFNVEKNQSDLDHYVNWLWTLVNCLFVVGGMIGSLSSKYVMDFGRKKGILIKHALTIVASLLVLSAPYFKSPVCFIISRFLYGIQGGLTSSLIPTYLSEISPAQLRGRTGLIHSICLTFGIFIGEVFGFTQIMGNQHLWSYLLGFPLIPSVLGGVTFLVFFPESPKSLLLSANDREAARKSLEKLRNDSDVDEEIEQILNEIKSTSVKENVSILGLFRSKSLRQPLLTSLGLHAVQQLCGINGITFYSSSIFLHANIDVDHIQYAIAATGAVNMASTCVSVFFIDRLGRIPLLVYPLVIIIVDFIFLTIFLNLNAQIFSYLSIVCILIFVMCFSVGLGPIPFIYSAEVFKQNARSSAMALGAFSNWTFALLITLIYPFLHILLKEMIFLVFLVLCVLFVLFILLIVPETKGKTVEEIEWKMNGLRRRKKRRGEESF